MAYLPSFAYEAYDREVTDIFLGYNHNLKILDGEWFNTKNLTTSYYPVLANRDRRSHAMRLDKPGGLLAKERLAFVDNGTLYYDDVPTAIKGLSDGLKQLVGMGAYICIFPDKVYYNTADPDDYGSMEARYSSYGEVRYTLCQIDGTDYPQPVVAKDAPENPDNADLWIDTGRKPNTLRQWSEDMEIWVEIPTVYTKLSFITTGELPGYFKEHDAVKISGAEPDVNGEKILYAVGGDSSHRDYVVVVGLIEEAITQTEGTVLLERTVPDMDYVCEAQNRLWGCKYGTNINEIYCCALGDFKNWRQYMGLSTDSWTASVGSDGPWTGAVNYLGYPMFFKENRIHKVLVSAVGAHQISETVCRGVQLGSSKSLCVVNETLFYKSRRDVCAYQGGFPSSISEPLGSEQYSDATAGTVGDKYYISMKDSAGQWHLFVYDIRRGLWMREDDLHVIDFARVKDELYCIADKSLIALLGTDGQKEAFVPWEAETGMLYYYHPDRKYLSRYNFRLWMPEGAELDVYIEYDSSGTWERKGRIKFKGTGTITVPVRPRRCDHMRIKLVGKGPIRLYSIARYLTIGSDVG